jgi:hypothetical protein
LLWNGMKSCHCPGVAKKANTRYMSRRPIHLEGPSSGWNCDAFAPTTAILQVTVLLLSLTHMTKQTMTLNIDFFPTCRCGTWHSVPSQERPLRPLLAMLEHSSALGIGVQNPHAS